MQRKKPAIYSWQPRKWQQQALSTQKKTTVLLCSRRAGKTDLCAYVAATALLTSTNPTSVCIASFSLKNAKAVVWSRLVELLSPMPSYLTYSKSDLIITNTRTGSTVKSQFYSLNGNLATNKPTHTQPPKSEADSYITAQKVFPGYDNANGLTDNITDEKRAFKKHQRKLAESKQLYPSSVEGKAAIEAELNPQASAPSTLVTGPVEAEGA